MGWGGEHTTTGAMMSPEVPAASNTCQYVPKKGKLPCQRVSGADSVFCPLHKPLSGDRTLCEHCKQMIKTASTTHAQKCSSFSLKTTQLPYYHHHCNMLPGPTSSLLSTDSESVDEHELATRVEALYLKYAPEFLDSSFLEKDSDDALSSLIDHEIASSGNPIFSKPSPSSTPITPTPSLKHRFQEEAIVECMEKHGLLNGIPGMFVEFGAGKGRLSKAIGSSEAANVAESCFICIEKSPYKHKAENNEHMRAYRARIDLSDVNLLKLIEYTEVAKVFRPKTKATTHQQQNVPLHDTDPGPDTELAHSINTTSGIQYSISVHQANRHPLGVVGIGKHVCGGATDLSLMALSNYLRDSRDESQGVCGMSFDTTTKDIAVNMSMHSIRNDLPSSSSSSSSVSPISSDSLLATGPQSPFRKIKGVALALCCHGLCSWDCYVGREWLQLNGCITEAEFALIRKWSGLFVVDSGQLAVDIEEAKKDVNNNHESEGTVKRSTQYFDCFSSRAKLGKMCKRLIDFGRMHFVRTHLKMRTRLVKYIDEAITPENVLLLAH